MGTTKSGFVWIHSHSYFTLPEEAIDECSGFLGPSQYGIKTTTTERTLFETPLSFAEASLFGKLVLHLNCFT